MSKLVFYFRLGEAPKSANTFSIRAFTKTQARGSEITKHLEKGKTFHD
ncbi:hypothetical protein [Pseudomonas fluorescens]|nr:hypothetical protein [Pseudomonas fluorescens]